MDVHFWSAHHTYFTKITFFFFFFFLRWGGRWGMDSEIILFGKLRSTELTLCCPQMTLKTSVQMLESLISKAEEAK